MPLLHLISPADKYYQAQHTQFTHDTSQESEGLIENAREQIPQYFKSFSQYWFATIFRSDIYNSLLTVVAIYVSFQVFTLNFK